MRILISFVLLCSPAFAAPVPKELRKAPPAEQPQGRRETRIQYFDLANSVEVTVIPIRTRVIQLELVEKSPAQRNAVLDQIRRALAQRKAIEE